MIGVAILIGAGTVVLLVAVGYGVRWLALRRQARLDAMTPAERQDEADRSAW